LNNLYLYNFHSFARADRVFARGANQNEGRSARPYMPEIWRAWEYWATRAGCGNKIGNPHGHAPKT